MENKENVNFIVNNGSTPNRAYTKPILYSGTNLAIAFFVSQSNFNVGILLH